MNKIVYLIGIFFIFIGCATAPTTYPEDNSISFDQNNADEYDLIVMDIDYEFYLKSIARPENFYSLEFYRNKNQNYVIEWNIRHNQPFRYNPDLYANRIDYNPRIDYGLNFEYKLYNFFKFIEWKYKIRL